VKGQVNWVSFEQLDELLEKEPRVVMIDVYANWCSYCKKMDSQTFTNTKVTEVLNTKFYALKLNNESNKKIKFKGIETSEAQLAAELRVTSLPTMIFLDPKLSAVTPVPGFRDANNFLEVLDSVLQYIPVK
jgi:thioredoxin-related protein